MKTMLNKSSLAIKTETNSVMASECYWLNFVRSTIFKRRKRIFSQRRLKVFLAASKHQSINNEVCVTIQWYFHAMRWNNHSLFNRLRATRNFEPPKRHNSPSFLSKKPLVLPIVKDVVHAWNRLAPHAFNLQPLWAQLYMENATL